MPLFCWLFLFAACSKIKDIHFILQRFQKKNFLFFESVEKSFTSVRKCAILYESPIEVWLSLVEHYVRDVGAASSNLVTSTIEKARSFGKFPVAACFVLSGKASNLCAICAPTFQKHTKKPDRIQQETAAEVTVLRGGFRFMPAPQSQSISS